MKPAYFYPLLSVAIASNPVWAQDNNADIANWAILLTAEDAPSSAPWTDPAYISASINKDAKDSFAYGLSLKAQRGVGNGFFLGPEVSWARNNEQTAPQNKFVAGLSLHWDSELDKNRDEDKGPFGEKPEHITTHYLDLSLGYARESVFADLAENGCDMDAGPVYCRTQHSESIQADFDYSPFNSAWEFQTGGIAFSFLPRLGLFWEDILDAVTDPEDLSMIDGSVFGAIASMKLVVARSLYDSPWSLGISLQSRHRLTAAAGRESSFEKSAQLMKISFDVPLYKTTGGKPKGFLPSIGLTYTNGEDPYIGFKKQEKLVLALKVAFE